MSVSAIVTTALDKCSKRDCEKYSEKKNTSQRKFASFSKNVVVMFLSFKQATTAWNKLIEHYKRHRRKMLIVFHSRSRFTLTTMQLIYFKMIQRQVLSFATSTNSQPATFKWARTRSKNCPFIHSVEKISWPKDKNH